MQDAGLNDFNFGPQAIVFIFRNQWHFFALNSLDGSSYVNIPLSSEIVQTGDWFHINMSVDAQSGLFDVRVDRADGSTLAEQSIEFPNWNPAFGQYDRLAIFDGEYAPVAQGGQFTVDNILYVPEPKSVATLLFAVGLIAILKRIA